MKQSETTVKIKNVSSNAEILNKTCPEIYDTSPRPGGFLKVMVPTRSQDYMVDGCSCATTDQATNTKKSMVSVRSSRFDQTGMTNFNISTASTTSREFRLRRAIEETDWEVTGIDETETVVGISTILQDTINMLAVTISCVMMMAADLSVPEDYLIWAQSYLQCIRDDEGLNPPNVQGIINEIIKRRDPNYKPNPVLSPSGEIKKKPGKEGSSSPNKSSSRSLSKTSSPTKKGSRSSQQERDARSNVSTLSAEKPEK